MIRIICGLLAAIMTTGCATMFNGSTQTLTLRSDVPGTKFYLDGQELGTNTATVPVSKKRLSDIVFIAKKDGCQDMTTGVTTKFDPTSLLGILIDFGLVTILIVDLSVTGAVHEAERTNYVLNPVCKN